MYVFNVSLNFDPISFFWIFIFSSMIKFWRKFLLIYWPVDCDQSMVNTAVLPKSAVSAKIIFSENWPANIKVKHFIEQIRRFIKYPQIIR